MPCDSASPETESEGVRPLASDVGAEAPRPDARGLTPAPRSSINIAAAVSALLHAGALVALVGWVEPASIGAIPQPSDAVSIELVASRTLETLQPKPSSEPAPAPDATAPVEGKPEASDTPVAKSEPTPEPKVIEPHPIPAPDATEEAGRAVRQDDQPTTDTAPIPEPVESPTPTEIAPEPPKAKAPEDAPPAKAEEPRKIERKPAERAPKGGITSKAKAGKGSGSERATASSGSILSYAARVRARVAANKPPGGGLRGTVVVAFGLTPSGGLAFARLVRSSGNAALDQRALAAVRGSAPFPPPPAGAGAGQLRFSIPFHFQ